MTELEKFEQMAILAREIENETDDKGIRDSMGQFATGIEIMFMALGAQEKFKEKKKQTKKRK